MCTLLWRLTTKDGINRAPGQNYITYLCERRPPTRFPWKRMPNPSTKRARHVSAIGTPALSYSHLASRFLSSICGRFILQYLKVFWGLSLIVLFTVIGVSSWQTCKPTTDWTFCDLADPVSDVTGIGIRLATYLQTLLTIFVEFYSAKQAGVVLHMNLAFIWALSILYWFATPSGITLNVAYIVLSLGNCIFLVTLSRIIFPIQDECDYQETLLTAFLRFVTYLLWGACYIFFWYSGVPANLSDMMVVISNGDQTEIVSQEEAQHMGACVQELRGWLFVPWKLERQPSNPVYVANSIIFGFCVGFFCLMSLRLFRMSWLVLHLACKSSAVDLGPGTESDTPVSEHLTQFCLQSMRRVRMPSRCRILLDAWCWFPSGDLKWIISPVSFFSANSVWVTFELHGPNCP